MSYVLRHDEDNYWYLVPLDKVDHFGEWAWVDEDGWPDQNTLPEGVERVAHPGAVVIDAWH